VHGIYPIALRTITVLGNQQVLRDIERAIKFSHATLHHIYLGDILNNLPLDDFSRTAEMLDLGYQRAKDYLTHPTPNQITIPVSAAAVVAPPGAVPYAPPW
jgi:hypothetical protein